MITKFKSTQRIAATILESDDTQQPPISLVMFVDIDRGIYGILTIQGDVNQQAIIREYNQNNIAPCESYRGLDAHLCRSLIEELQLSAASL